MNKQNFFKKLGTSMFLLGATGLVKAQNLGLGDAGNKILAEIEKAFPFIVGVAFVFVGWRAFNQYEENGKDVMAAIKVLIWFVVVLLVFVALYKFVKSVAL